MNLCRVRLAHCQKKNSRPPAVNAECALGPVLRKLYCSRHLMVRQRLARLISSLGKSLATCAATYPALKLVQPARLTPTLLTLQMQRWALPLLTIALAFPGKA